jgi:hypothetical protein
MRRSTALSLAVDAAIRALSEPDVNPADVHDALIEAINAYRRKPEPAEAKA